MDLRACSVARITRWAFRNLHRGFINGKFEQSTIYNKQYNVELSFESGVVEFKGQENNDIFGTCVYIQPSFFNFAYTVLPNCPPHLRAYPRMDKAGHYAGGKLRTRHESVRTQF